MYIRPVVSPTKQALCRILRQSFWSKLKIATDTNDCDVGRRPVASRNRKAATLRHGATRNPTAPPSLAVGFSVVPRPPCGRGSFSLGVHPDGLSIRVAPILHRARIRELSSLSIASVIRVPQHKSPNCLTLYGPREPVPFSGLLFWFCIAQW